MERHNSSRIIEIAKNNMTRLSAASLASVALAGCHGEVATSTPTDGCRSLSGVINPGEELNPGTTDKGTSVTLVNLFGSGEENYSAVVIETKNNDTVKELAIVDYDSERTLLPTGETLEASTLPTDTAAVDGFVEICPDFINE